MEIYNIIRRIRAGESDRHIQRVTGKARGTIRKYREWAEAQGLLEGEMPSLPELHQQLASTLPETPPPQNVSSVAPYHDLIEGWLEDQVEIAAMHQRLQERGFTGSYMAVYRYAQKLIKKEPDATLRIERPPGEEAQIDFGYTGTMPDPDTGKMRKTWCFVMTLSYSRYQYVEFVYDQKLPTWLSCHQRAFEFFGGVPERLVVDNLKAAITRACFYEPQASQAYSECAQHYGFRIDPCDPRTPEHKGKVEKGGVHYVKRNFLGGREPTTLCKANQDVRRWCLTTAGRRCHGTTKAQPLARFEDTEKATLQPLPDTPYDIGIWKTLKLHRDCYIVFDGSYYSAPFRCIGQKLRVRAGCREVCIYDQEFQLLATHDRAQEPGQRMTLLDHLPPTKIDGLTRNREDVQKQADLLGEAVGMVVRTLLDDQVMDRLDTAARLLKLANAFGAERLENACRRALAFEDPAYMTVKRILTQGLDTQPLPEAYSDSPAAEAFVRSLIDLVGSSLGGLSWK
jgi:transposase